MPRFFNTAGPCDPADHYMLPPLRRLPELRRFIDRKQYFVLYAPPQTGKTTVIGALAQTLTAEGRYAAIWVTGERGQAFTSDVGAAEIAVIEDWRLRSESLPEALRPPPWPDAPAGTRIRAALTAWAQACPRPLVVFIDQIDALRDDALVSVLCQLRAGYTQRSELFPWSLALVGLRDVRDYVVSTADSSRLDTVCLFDIKVESLTLAGFSRNEVAELYAQHTADTGQVFEHAAIDRAHWWSNGQPWLVNALAEQLVDVLSPSPTQTIGAEAVDRAARILLERQDTHLDRLREPRIRSIVEPAFAGEIPVDVPHDAQRLAVDLGLLCPSEQGGLEVANPIYREIIRSYHTRRETTRSPSGREISPSGEREGVV